MASDELYDRKPDEIVSYWAEEIRLAEKYFERWRNEAKDCVRAYEAYSEGSSDDSRFGNNPNYNIFWSNINSIQPALYARTPKAEVERRFGDNDPVALASSHLLERALQFTIDDQDFDDVMERCRDDLLIVGRGVSWIRYFAETVEDDQGPIISSQRVNFEYVYWEDFLHNPARRWGRPDIRWTARRVFLSKADIKKRFSIDDVPLDYTPKYIEAEGDKYADGRNKSDISKSTVWEIWCADSNKVYFINPAYKAKPLQVMPPPLKLKGFFPCPRPLYATRTTSSCRPIPDFRMYSNLQRELNEVCDKISALRSALRVAGVYDASLEGIERILKEDRDLDLVPVENWGRFMQAGGFDKGIQYLPFTEVADVLMRLLDLKAQLKNDVYEITGWSDIMRGQTEASETATAQQIKGNFATLRLAGKQKDVQRFARDMIRLGGEIIADEFEPQSLRDMGGAEQFLQDEQQFMEAVALLKDDPRRQFRIGIETDSTISIDEQQQKEEVKEFLGGFNQLLQTFLPIMGQFPPLVGVLSEIMLFAVRRFRAGRTLETSIEEALKSIQQMQQQQQEQQQNQPPPPDPKAQEVQARLQLDGSRLQLEGQKAQADNALAQQKIEQEHQARMQAIDTQAQAKMAELEQRMQLEAAKIQAQMQTKLAEFASKEQIATNQGLAKEAADKRKSFEDAVAL